VVNHSFGQFFDCSASVPVPIVNDDIRHANFWAASSDGDGVWQLTSAAPDHVVGKHKNYCYLMVGDEPENIDLVLCEMKLCVDCQQLITPEHDECLFDPEQLCRECWFKKHPEVPALCPECEVRERKVGGEVLSTMRYSVIKGKTPQC
jgi:hypothetical protein